MLAAGRGMLNNSARGEINFIKALGLKDSRPT